MAQDLEKRTGELWTNYFARRINALGKGKIQDEGEAMSYELDYDNLAMLVTRLRTNEGSIEVHTFLNVARVSYFNQDHLGVETVDDLLQEGVTVNIDDDINGDRALFFEFTTSGASLDFDGASIEGFPPEFQSLGNSPAPMDAIDAIVNYAERVGYVVDFANEGVTVDGYDLIRKDGRTEPDLAQQIRTMAREIRELRQTVTENPFAMRPEGDYLKTLYVDAINRDGGNLRVFEFDGQQIPYVLVSLNELSGFPGKPFKNLYFVAEETAPEIWQQQLVAYHESLCVRIGHDKAKAKEIDLARHLGVEKEYTAWRAEIDKLHPPATKD